MSTRTDNGIPKDLVLIGLGRFAERTRYYFETFTHHRVVAFSAEQSYCDRESFLGLPVIPFEEITQHYSPERYSLFVSIGYRDHNAARQRVCTQARAFGYPLASCVAPTAVIHDAVIGANSLIMDQVVLGPFARLGEGAIVAPGAVVSHHSALGDFCYISSNATIAGNCSIGARVFLGSGAAISDGLTVAPESFIGIGSVVTKPISRRGVYAGTPARYLREQFERN